MSRAEYSGKLYSRRDIYGILCGILDGGRERHPEFKNGIRAVALAFELDWDSVLRVAGLMPPEVEHETD